MFDILRKSFATGVVTTNYPEGNPEISPQARGCPKVNFTAWHNPHAALKACPTGAIKCGERDGMRTVSLDVANCTFCGLCAEVEPAIRMTNQCELASERRSDLVLSAEYELKTGAPRLIREFKGPGGGASAENSPRANKDLGEVGQELRRRISKTLGRSLHIREVDAGSCNGCEIEIEGLNSPVYDIERFGIHFVASPRHADMLLVTGPVSRNMELALRKTYEAMPEPRLVVAVGACGCAGGIFGQNYATIGGVDKVVPVDVYIPGCPPNPHALLHGILLAIDRLPKA